MKLPSLPHAVEDIVTDEKVLSAKKKVMGSLRWNSLLNSVSDTFKFIAGVLTAAGMAITLPSFATNIGLGLGGAIAAVPAVGLAVLGAAAAVTTIAVASSYIASRIWQSRQFDNLEVGAQSTAHHLVQEIELHNMCMTQARNDGKSWCETVQAQKTAERIQSL